MSNDVLSQLQETSWRAISFPSLTIGAAGGHNLVAHKRMDRNGWRVENTGQESYVFEVKIPFINTIVRGPNETWKDLFPTTYRKVLAALEDRTSDYFTHPTYGRRLCKAHEWKETIDPDFRGGPTLNVQFWETVDEGDQVSIAESNPLAICLAAATSLDARFLPLKPPPKTGTPGGMGLLDFVKSIGAVADRWNLLKAQVVGKINSVVSALTNLEQKFAGDPGFSDDTNRLISGLHALKRDILKADKQVSVYRVPKATTVGALARQLRAPLDDLFALNPVLASGPLVPADTIVRHYS